MTTGTFTAKLSAILVLLFVTFQTTKCDTCSAPAICSCDVDVRPKSSVTAPLEQPGNSPLSPLSLSSHFNINVAENICKGTKMNDTGTSPNIVLNCSYIDLSANTTSIPSKDAAEGAFYLTLNYPCSPPHVASHYSTGSILVIIFFTLVFAYLVLGMAVNFFILGARGLELIPNLSFWRDLPGLVKDGVVFVQNGFKVPQTELHPRSPESYDAI